MKIELVLVTSLNGKITRGISSNIYDWTSKEDQNFFFSLIKKCSLIIMGRKTYEAAKSYIQLVPGKLRVVMTRNKEKYNEDVVPNQLEFSEEPAVNVVSDLEHRGYSNALLVGGSDIAELFLADKLVTTVCLTLEPYLFGEGELFLDQTPMQTRLKLINVKRMNERGTLLCRYRVLYE